MENFIRLSAIASSLACTQRMPLSLSCSRQKGHSHAQNVAKTKKKGEEEKSAKLNGYRKRLNEAAKHGTDPKLNSKLADLISDYRKDSLPLATMNKWLEKYKTDNAKKTSSSPPSNKET